MHIYRVLVCVRAVLTPDVAIVGGNWNNGVHVGGRYVNLNNLASNANGNIGSRLPY